MDMCESTAKHTRREFFPFFLFSFNSKLQPSVLRIAKIPWDRI